MDWQAVIDKYYPEDNRLRYILMTHSRQVADKALNLASRHPELALDLEFIEEAAMLHDIGIFMCDADGIYCFGTKPYICHGTIGADLLRAEGFPCHALVCERHTGAGIPLAEIIERDIPVPHRDLMPLSMEEKLICYADKFFSKTKLEREKTFDEACQSLLKFGPDTISRFNALAEQFE